MLAGLNALLARKGNCRQVYELYFRAIEARTPVPIGDIRRIAEYIFHGTLKDSHRERSILKILEDKREAILGLESVAQDPLAHIYLDCNVRLNRLYHAHQFYEDLRKRAWFEAVKKVDLFKVDLKKFKSESSKNVDKEKKFEEIRDENSIENSSSYENNIKINSSDENNIKINSSDENNIEINIENNIEDNIEDNIENNSSFENTLEITNQSRNDFLCKSSNNYHANNSDISDNVSADAHITQLFRGNQRLVNSVFLLLLRLEKVERLKGIFIQLAKDHNRHSSLRLSLFHVHCLLTLHAKFDFDRMVEILELCERINVVPNIRTFNIIMNACLREGRLSVIPKLIRIFKEVGLVPNDSTLQTLLQWCDKRGDVISAELLFFEWRLLYRVPVTPILVNSLLKVYLNQRQYLRAQVMFIKLLQQFPDINSTFDTVNVAMLMRSLFLEGHYGRVLSVWEAVLERSFPESELVLYVLASRLKLAPENTNSLQIISNTLMLSSPSSSSSVVSKRSTTLSGCQKFPLITPFVASSLFDYMKDSDCFEFLNFCCSEKGFNKTNRDFFIRHATIVRLRNIASLGMASHPSKSFNSSAVHVKNEKEEFHDCNVYNGYDDACFAYNQFPVSLESFQFLVKMICDRYPRRIDILGDFFFMAMHDNHPLKVQLQKNPIKISNPKLTLDLIFSLLNNSQFSVKLDSNSNDTSFFNHPKPSSSPRPRPRIFLYLSQNSLEDLVTRLSDEEYIQVVLQKNRHPSNVLLFLDYMLDRGTCGAASQKLFDSPLIGRALVYLLKDCNRPDLHRLLSTSIKRNNPKNMISGLIVRNRI